MTLRRRSNDSVAARECQGPWSGRPHPRSAASPSATASFEVFRGIDFDVGAREIVALVGPSGCGKTTLLRCIDGLLPVDEGEVLVDGRARRRAASPASRWCSSISACFRGRRSTTTSPTGCAWRASPRAEIARRVPQFIDLVGLAGFETAYPYQMSGGMQQRCGLARALAIEPSVLLMDEPFAAVDAQTREILQFELLRIWEQRPTTMVFVTHSIEEAVLMGDRVFVLKGRPSSITTPSPSTCRGRARATRCALPRFAELRERVWGTLMSEARQAEFQLGHADERPT